jgi:hypothetical protein
MAKTICTVRDTETTKKALLHRLQGLLQRAGEKLPTLLAETA